MKYHNEHLSLKECFMIGKPSELHPEASGSVSQHLPLKRITADAHRGLTREQVEAYIRAGCTNRAVDPPSKSISEIIKSNLFTYFNLIFLIIAILLILVGSFRDLTFLPVIFANIGIGIFQEIRAKKTLDHLTMLHAPKAKVIRDGTPCIVLAEELVLDDIAVYEAGNQINADAVILEGDVSVNESLLTGEADEISKGPGDFLLSGSYVVSGTCHARLEKVGEDSYISRLTLEAKAIKEGEQSEMIRSLNRLVKIVGILIIPISLLLFGQQYFFADLSFRESVTSMVAAVLGMIPEGLYLLASVALVVSVIRLAKQKVLLHDMKCIETLARVDVLCLDKTGTITETCMQIEDVIPVTPSDNGDHPPLSQLISDFAAAMSNDNDTIAALKSYFHAPATKSPVSVNSFSALYKYSSVTFSDETYVLGAPEFVLRDEYESYRELIEPYALKGYRVLVFASYPEDPGGKKLTKDAVLLGLIVLSNPIREKAAETFRYFSEQGVSIKVISGDNPVTVSEIARQAGIEHADQYLDASVLKSEDEIREAILTHTVFGRVTPEQKRQFVKALKAAGKTVAMTGDGVNDILALKDADCSIAMASGSDAAAQAAQLVLLDSDFSHMPSVVCEGRRVVNNIQRSASLFLVKNIFSFLLSMFSVCFMINYPLEPSQISLISMFTIGIPAFFLALQPNHNRIEGHFLTNVLLKALPAGLTDFLIVGALVIFGQEFAVSPIDISTACTMLLAIVGFMILYRICQPMNALRWVILLGCIAGLILCSVFLSDLFAITGMSTKCVMLFVIFSIATEPILYYSIVVVDFLRTCHQKRRIAKRGF